MPATIALGLPRKPPPLLEFQFEAGETLPATGGATPSSISVAVWVLLSGIALIGTGVFMTAYRRRRYE